MIPQLDFSIRLNYAIGIIGKNDTKTINGELVLNQGSERWCKDSGGGDVVISSSYYCEFERLFEQDLVRAFSSYHDTKVEVDQVLVLFVKQSGMDGVIVTCRFMPPANTYRYMLSNDDTGVSSMIWVKDRLDKLRTMVSYKLNT